MSDKFCWEIDPLVDTKLVRDQFYKLKVYRKTIPKVAGCKK